MNKLRFGTYLLGAVAVVAGLASCADESPWGSSSGEKGSISLTLTTDLSFDTAKPLFRSGEETNTNNLGNFITVPTQDKFTFTLQKSGSEEDPITWTDKEQKVAAGAYDLTAHYGTKGKQGFNVPYFEAKTSVTILPGRTSNVDLSAELKNSMVQIIYTKEFQNYMSDYAVSLRTEGLTDMIEFPSKTSSSGTTNADATENKISEIAFIEPNEAEIFIGFTTKNTGITVPSYSLGKFPPVAKTLYRITLDVTERETGTAQLVVSFDESMTEEDRYIDLTEELLTSAAPEITPEGFTDGESINVLDYTEASNMTLKMTVFAQGGLESASLTITGPESPLSTWSNEINLVGASDTQKTALSYAGIDATTFFGILESTNTIAELDLTSFCQKLASGSFAKGIYKVLLTVKDNTGKSDEISLSLDSNDIQLSPAAGTEQQTIDYESDEVVLMLDYNGESNDDINFKYVDGNNEVSINNVKIEEVIVAGKPATRAYSNHRYRCTLTLPEAAKKSSITIKAYYPGGSKTFDFNVKVPGYKLEYDAFAHYAYIKIVPDSNDDLNTILKNITYTLNNNPITPQTVSGYNNVFLITGLSSSPENGTDYTLQSAITTDTKTTITFTTEKEEAIPNGDFSAVTQTINMTGVQVGGTYTGTALSRPAYHWSSSIVRDTPDGWATINAKTCYTGASNINTWFCVPSTYAENGKVIIRSVGYDHNGTTPDNYNKTLVYYNNKAPSFGEGKQIAGELFLGSYKFDGSEHRTEGIEFNSRPVSVTFSYKYEPLNNENASAEFIVCDASGNEIAKATDKLDAASEETSKTLQFNGYSKFGVKAAIIKAKFKSSTATLPYINIPTGSALKEKDGVHEKNETLDANTYNAVAVGSVLTIDDVSLGYNK
ncbi:MAG: DUF4493 domain-containing protein [Muribaculum sp.]|nr:DUF4493 domain-containing protein [Muribaculum sp.]